MDPADRWVFNPRTGTYELRPSVEQRTRQASALNTEGPAAARHAPSRQRRASSGRSPSAAASSPSPPASSSSSPSPSSAATAASPRSAAGSRRVPAQRDHRASGSRRKPRQRSSRTRRILVWTGGTLAMLLVIGCAGAWYMVSRLNDNITRVDVGIENNFSSDEPVNILFIGTDKRTGQGNEGYGDNGNEGHADTTILLHFSQDRSHATALSIPRDLITDIPDCQVTDADGAAGTVPGEQGVRFGYSLGVNGRDPGCTWRTVEEMTGVRINHFMMADFNAVKDLSSAVGGVEVCLAEDIDDPKSHLRLPAGRHRIEGEQALAFVRTRYSVGLGSDLSRIELQQQFLGSMARQVNSSNTLTNPRKLWDLANTATRALTVDTGLGSIQKLNDLARDLGRVPVSDIAFVTLPVVDNPDEPEGAKATVVINERKAAPLFRMLQEDLSLTDAKGKDKGGNGGKKGGGNGDAPPMAPAEDVRADVYNGGDIVGAAQETVSWLQNSHGALLTTNAGNAAAPQETTTLEYGPDQAGMAARLADLMGLPKAAMDKQSEDAGETPMILTLGNDFRGAGEPIEVPAEKPEDVDTITADDEDVCAS